jgi:hypothetical protein
MRKVGAFLARFKGLKASRPQIKRVVEERKFSSRRNICL